MKLHVNISWFSHTDNEIEVFYIKSWNICTYYVYFKSKKELDYNRFVDPNILGASRLVHSDLRIYRISFFLLVILTFGFAEQIENNPAYFEVHFWRTPLLRMLIILRLQARLQTMLNGF